jgi:aerobic C4-dicarboxylate transport protein
MSATTVRLPRWRRLHRDLSVQIFSGMVAGALLGHYAPHAAEAMKPLGDSFIKLIRMVVGPIIFCTVVHGIAGMHDARRTGRVAIKAIIYFEAVTTLALVIGLLGVNLMQPGVGLNLNAAQADSSLVQSYIGQTRHFTAGEFFLNIIPTTLFSALAEGEILQILLVAILFAFGLLRLGPSGAPMLRIIDGFSRILFQIVGFVMVVAPIGAFGAIAFTVGRFGAGSLVNLGKLVGEFWLICAIFIAAVLWPIARVCGFSLVRLMAYIWDELLIVIGTSSSETVYPRMTEKLTRLGVDGPIVGIVLPTAYSFNHDGTCLYFAVASVFLAQATNTPFGLADQLALLAILLLTSKGAAGVSGAAIVVLAVTISATGSIPVGSIGLILGVHRLLSSAFVFTNIVGNAVATIAVGKWENAVDGAVLQRELAER